MPINKVKQIAKQMDLKTYGMNKMDMILTVQGSENNIECFATERVEYCPEDACL